MVELRWATRLPGRMETAVQAVPAETEALLQRCQMERRRVERRQAAERRAERHQVVKLRVERHRVERRRAVRCLAAMAAPAARWAAARKVSNIPL